MRGLRKTAGLLLISAATSISSLALADDLPGSAGLLLWVKGEPELESPQGDGERARPGLLLKAGRTISLSRGQGLILWADGGLKVLGPGQELAVPQPVSKAGDEGMIARLAEVLMSVHQAPVKEEATAQDKAGSTQGNGGKIRLVKPRNSAILAADLSFHWSGRWSEKTGPDKARLVLKAARVGFELALPVSLTSGRASLPKDIDPLLPGLRYSWCLQADDDLLSAPAWFTILSLDEEDHLRARVTSLRRLEELPLSERLLAEAELLAAYGLFNRAGQTLEEVLDLDPDSTSARELMGRLAGLMEHPQPAQETDGPDQAQVAGGTAGEN